MIGIAKRTLLNILIKAIRNREVCHAIDEIVATNQKNLGGLINHSCPYFINSANESSIDTPSPIFITSRFRSGSTLLWNIFRNIDNCTSYYEPFNERRWFDSSFRGTGVDNTHIGVDDYWSEYDGMDDLAAFYNDDWIKLELFMDKKSWNVGMKKYIQQLISRSQGSAVLQFNRVDFRLPWLRQNFPNAKIIHLYRNPRDQWLSFLKDKESMNKEDVHLTYVDSFYLDPWCNDLEKHFPFLSVKQTPHPYQRFYYIWKLSYIYGRLNADISLSFEELVSSPTETLQTMFDKIGWSEIEYDTLLPLIKRPMLDRWKGYADDAWFLQHEKICEGNLSSFIDATKKSGKV